MKNFNSWFRRLLGLYLDLIEWHAFFVGNCYFIRLVWFRLLRLVLHYETLYLFKKEVEKRDEPPENRTRISFLGARQKDLEEIAKMNPNRQGGFISERLEKHEICYVALSREGKLCAYFWVAPGSRVFRYRSKEIVIGAHEVYIRDIQTLPEYRGRGITPQFLNWINGELHKKNIKTILAGIKGWNYSSQKSFRKAGFHVDEKVYYAALPWLNHDIVISRKRRKVLAKERS